jgi:hypothetical protein
MNKRCDNCKHFEHGNSVMGLCTFDEGGFKANIDLCPAYEKAIISRNWRLISMYTGNFVVYSFCLLLIGVLLGYWWCFYHSHLI